MSMVKPSDIKPDDWAYIVDVRTRDEYLLEHIPNTLNVPLDQIGLAGNQLRQQPRVILACRSGRRSLEAKVLLEEMGCRKVDILEGGLLAWRDGNHPTRQVRQGLSIIQQEQILSGSMVLLGILFYPFLYFALLVAIGLLISGLMGSSVIRPLLLMMPWNQPESEGDEKAPVASVQQPSCPAT